MDRIINVKVNGGLLTLDSRKAGNQYEANITKLRITFDPSWDGYAKTVVFRDAKGLNPVKRVLTADLLDQLSSSTRVYRCPIPGEALTECGMMSFVIEGYLDGVRQRALKAELEVEESFDEAGADPVDPTPTQAEQLQVQIDTVLGDIQAEAIRAEEAADAAAQSENFAGMHATAAGQAQTAAETAKIQSETAQSKAEAARAGAETAQRVVENLLQGSGGGGGGSLYVTMTRKSGNYTADKPYADVEAAVVAGMSVVSKHTTSDGVTILAPVVAYMDGQGIIFGAVTCIMGEMKFYDIGLLPDEFVYITTVPISPGME